MKNIALLFFISVPLFSQQEFSFAHITDTHVGSSTGAEDLRRTVNDINSLNALSFAIITGDITEFGSDDQFRLAKQILDSLSIPWYIVPGNHDMKWSASGGTSFAAIFGSERFVFDYQGYRFIGLHQGPRIRMGDAYWTEDDVSWLDSVLSTTPLPDSKSIIATHYPADSGIANWYRVTDVARKHNVQAFLNGHWHRNYYGLFDGIPGMVGRSNLRAADSIGGYNIVTIRNDSLTCTTRIPGVETKLPWKTVSLGDRNYSNDGFQRVQPLNIYSERYPNISVAWKMTSRSPMTAPPAISQKYRAYAFHDGTIHLYSRSNKKLFELRVPAPVFAAPALDDEKIVVSSTDSSIYCFDLSSKKILWKVRTGAAVIAPPVIDQGMVFCGASDKIFRAIDLNSGRILWSYDSLQGHVEAKPLVTKEKVIIGAWDEHLYCFDRRTGKLEWKWKSDRNGVLLSPAVCEPVTAHGKIFIVAPDRFMTAVNIITGKQLWRTNRFQVRETIGLSEDGERVYIRTMNDSLYALSTRAEQPEIVWSLNAGFGYDINSSQLKEKDGILFCTTKNGLLLAIDGKKGEVLWKFKENVVIAHTPIPLSGKRVIFSNVLGTVCEVVAQ